MSSADLATVFQVADDPTFHKGRNIMKRFYLIALGVALGICPVVQADELEFRGENGRSSLTATDVRIRGVDGENIIYLTQSGSEARRPLAQVGRMLVNGENAFNDAETAFAAEKWAQAGDFYRTALRTTTKDFLKDRIGLRLVEVANKTDKFDLAVTAYVILLTRNPTLAANVRPAVPQDKQANAKALADSAAVITGALGDSKLANDRRSSLLQLALEIERVRGDQKAQAALVEQLLRLAPADGSNGDLHAIVALTALDSKDFPKAIDEIEKNRKAFTEPQQQADALWVLAEARYQQAAASDKPLKKEDWQDMAISFMGVVAQFKESPHAADALLRTGACYEKLQEPKKAIEVYTQLTKEYPQSPAAKTAVGAIASLKSAGG